MTIRNTSNTELWDGKANTLPKFFSESVILYLLNFLTFTLAGYNLRVFWTSDDHWDADFFNT